MDELTSPPADINQTISPQETNLENNPKKNKKLFFIILIILFLLLSISLIFILSLSGKNKLSNSSATTVLKNSPTISPEIANQKIPNLPTFEANFTESGILFAKPNQLFIFNPETEKTELVTKFTDANIWNVEFSPNRDKISYVIVKCNTTLTTCFSYLGIIEKESKNTILIVSRQMNKTGGGFSIPFKYHWVGSNNIIYNENKKVYKYDVSQKTRNFVPINADSDYIYSAGESIYYIKDNSIYKFFVKDNQNSLFIAKSDLGVKEITDYYVSPNENYLIYSDSAKAILIDIKNKQKYTLGEYNCSGYSFGNFSPDSSRFYLSSGCGDMGSTELFDSNGNKVNTFPNQEIENTIKSYPEINNQTGISGGAQIAFGKNDNIFALIPFSFSSEYFSSGFKYGFILNKDGNIIKKVNFPNSGIKLSTKTQEDRENNYINFIDW